MPRFSYLLPSSLCLAPVRKFKNRQENILYAHHYNPQFVYFLPTFRSPKTFFQWAFFLKFWPYVWLVFKSGFKSRAGYDGAHTVDVPEVVTYLRKCWYPIYIALAKFKRARRVVRKHGGIPKLVDLLDVDTSKVLCNS